MVRGSARGSFILLLGQVVSTVVAAIGSILVARFLGSTSYGQVTVAMIPVSIAALFGDWGVSSALIKFIAQYRFEQKTEELKAFVQTGLLLKAAGGVFLSLIIFFLSGFLAVNVFHQPRLKLLIEIASANLFAQSLISTSQSIFIGFERMEFHSLTVIIASILKSLLAPILVLLGYGAFGAVLGKTVPIVVTGILGITIVAFAFLKDGSSSRSTLGHLQASKILLSYGYPLFLSKILTGGLSQFYNFLIAIYVDVSMIGNYKAATNFSVLITFLTMPIASVLFPLFSKLDVEEGSTLRLVFQSSVKYWALISVPAIAGMITLSGQLIRIIYGSSYQFAPFFLKLYLVLFLYEGLGSLCSVNMLKGQGRTKVIFLKNLLNICIGLPLSLILIPQFGIVGLLLTLIAPKPGDAFTLWWIKKNFGFTINWFASAKIYLSASIAYLVATCLLAVLHSSDWLDLLLGGGVFVLTYALLVSLTGVLDRDDIQNLRNIMSVLGPLEPLFNLVLTLVERLMRKTHRA